MRRLRILVDMDDTIEHLLDAWIRCLNERHGTTVKYADGAVASYDNATEMFDRLMQVMLHFFETGEVGVDENETIWIAEILEAAKFAEENPGCWVEV